MKKVISIIIFGLVLINYSLLGQNTEEKSKKIPRKEVTTKTSGDKITTTTIYTKPGRQTVISVVKKGNCLVSKSKIVYNTRTTYLTGISSGKLIYDSLHCNKLVKKVVFK